MKKTKGVISILNLIKEVSTQTYEYGCIMLYFGEFKELLEIHNFIKKSDIYTEEEDKSFGLEDEPHCTLLYGLHEEVSVSEIKEVVKDFKFEECILSELSLFENEKYDVLKFDVIGDNLHECNKALKNLPYTTDFPNYKPHLTVGYLKKGKGKSYLEKLRKKYRDISLSPKNIVYSTPNDGKFNISM